MNDMAGNTAMALIQLGTIAARLGHTKQAEEFLNEARRLYEADPLLAAEHPWSIERAAQDIEWLANKLVEKEPFKRDPTLTSTCNGKITIRKNRLNQHRPNLAKYQPPMAKIIQ